MAAPPQAPVLTPLARAQHGAGEGPPGPTWDRPRLRPAAAVSEARCLPRQALPQKAPQLRKRVDLGQAEVAIPRNSRQQRGNTACQCLRAALIPVLAGMPRPTRSGLER